MTLRMISEEASTWLFKEALPFWAEAGLDHKYGGFIEELTFAGEDARIGFKRTRVACRQMYVFSHALMLGWGDGRDHIARGGQWLIDKAWTGEGFVRRTTREGEWLDPTPDLYDHAFALFGFAWAYRATGESAWAEWAARTLDVIERRFSAANSIAGGEGYLHQLPATGWRLQNPHMHLLEASLAAYEATGEAAYRSRAIEVAELFARRFFQASTGSLAEHYRDDWSLAPGAPGDLVEPGHQLEWVWILGQCGRLLGADMRAQMAAMTAFAERCGVDRRSGAVRNSVDKNGGALDGGSRTWPNTERIKAGVALAGLGAAELPAGVDPRAMIEGSARLLLDRYLGPEGVPSIPRGGWRDAFDATGRCTAERMPASTFYHLFLAFAEMLYRQPAQA